MSISPRAALILLCSALALPSIASAALTIDGKPKVGFVATGSPGFMTIEGEGSTLTVADDGTRLVFTVPMETVSSGISLRDHHMNKHYVETDKFPNVVLDLPKADVNWPTGGNKSVDGQVNGNLTFHGVTQPVNVAYSIAPIKGGGYRVKAKYDFDVSQHGITIEPYMGVSFDHHMNATVAVDLLDVP